MRKILFLLFSVVAFYSHAQIYKYIGVEDGLSNQQVFSIQKGEEGYMWFLTRYGIDRYNGQSIKQYKLINDDKEVNSMLSLGWLSVDGDGILWEIGRRGHVFRYNALRDRFDLAYQLPDSIFDIQTELVSGSLVDSDNRVWMFRADKIHLYDSRTATAVSIPNGTGADILCAVQRDSTYYFGTSNGLYAAQLNLPEHRLDFRFVEAFQNLHAQVDAMYFDPVQEKLFIATLLQGIYLYDLRAGTLTKVTDVLDGATITCIRPYTNGDLLVATNGLGVYRMSTHTYECTPYIVADYNSYNGMNGNNIFDLYVDGHRIWMSNYPIGVTLRNSEFPAYTWIKHSIGNPQSLINNQVNFIIEDYEGDIWYATNNGVSLYRRKDGTWRSFQGQLTDEDNHSHIFLTLCEVRPGIVWASGYGYIIYELNKHTGTVTRLTPADYKAHDLAIDKYIRTMCRDSQGQIWAGGYYNLKRLDYDHKRLRLYDRGLNGITDIIECDSARMWIGTATGLYLLNKESGNYEGILLPSESLYVTSLHQSGDSILYIGTNSSGMIVYDFRNHTFAHYNKGNSGLLSNCINNILDNERGQLILATDRGLTGFSPATGQCRNWTAEQGLKTQYFNPQSGIVSHDNRILLGSSDGAITFNRDIVLPSHYDFKIMFSDLRIFYRTVYPGDEGSPLTRALNDTPELRLSYGQSIFSILITPINYDYPSLMLYTWRLAGFYDEWSEPDEYNRIRFNNLKPGRYTLQVRAVSSEDPRITLQERHMSIVVSRPFWSTIWAWMLYTILAVAVIIVIIRYMQLKRQREVSNEKIRFFINTAHDIRTPLTLIKAPLEEVVEKEPLTEGGQSNVGTALRNVNALLRLVSNLINFERADSYSATLYVAQYELTAYMNEVVNTFRSYADTKQIELTYESNFSYLNVLLDKDKMDSILKNILSNALKYTPEGGQVRIKVQESEAQWSVEVADNGIGIPAAEQRHLFKTHFRSSNAVNSKVTGSGIGMMLVWKLVHIHKGRIVFHSAEGRGTEFKVIFPREERFYSKAIRRRPLTTEATLYSPSGVPQEMPAVEAERPVSHHDTTRQDTILVVEDNDELRNYLLNTLSDTYTVQVSENGRAALDMIRAHSKPDLIISDVMMPEMRGDELTHILKNDIETSHIPIILLTALSTDTDIIDGLSTGADRYVVKPFNIGILRANIANLLANRALLRQRYTSIDPAEDETAERDALECIDCSELDRKFITTVRQHIEEHLDSSTFNVDTLCTLLFMSRTSFYNKMKALTDQAPADYIRLIRLKHAARLLRDGSHNVTEVSEMTGFSDAKYFREVFKKYYNVSPSQYGKQT
ncbi:MAG: response regulator [Prevotellaceae bacterium]|jgi:signal transduction histidine kinase/DNA-binding response OmpR family regulator/ligand-binding sensor domain-containing protein|nr:response regulator [Prevotellaceae bacterium]